MKGPEEDGARPRSRGLPGGRCKPGSARIAAAIAILDRGWGKPTQAVEANVSVFDRMTDDEQRVLLAALEALKGD
jgi:hypothetical protein